MTATYAVRPDGKRPAMSAVAEWTVPRRRKCAGQDGVGVLKRLFAREGRVLRQRGRDVVPARLLGGPARPA